MRSASELAFSFSLKQSFLVYFKIFNCFRLKPPLFMTSHNFDTLLPPISQNAYYYVSCLFYRNTSSPSNQPLFGDPFLHPGSDVKVAAVLNTRQSSIFLLVLIRAI